MQPAADLTDARVARALGHPLRARILAALDVDEASPVELSRRLDAPLGTVSYHVKILAELGLIKLTRTTPRRGAVEHHYRSRPRPRPKRKDWDALPPTARADAAGAAAQALIGALKSAAKGSGFLRAGTGIETHTMQLDEAGWRELRKELEAVSKRLDVISKDSRKRGAEGDAESIEAGVALVTVDLGQ